MIALLVWFRRFRREFRNAFKTVEIELYDLNKKLEPIFHSVSFLLVIFAVASVTAAFGFELSERMQRWNGYLDFAIITGFVLIYISRLLLTSKRIQLVKNRLLESFFFLLLLLFGLVYLLGGEELLVFFEQLIGLQNSYEVVLFFIKVYLVVFVVVKFIQATPILLSLQRHPAQIIVGCFAGIILIGAFLLMMPRTTVDGEGLRFIDALFTSTSAVCVTGLIVVDTATHFTMLGQIVIMALIQIGGIGIITFATLFALFISDSLGVGQMTFLKDIVSEDRAAETFATIKRIVGMTLFVEALGVAGYYLSWTGLFPDAGERFWFALFHSVSAFCNAGFSLFTNSLADDANVLNWGVNITTILLIIFGGLGFTTVWELVRGNPRRQVRNRQMSVHTRLVLIATAFLIVSGTVAFLVLEWDRTLAPYSGSEKVLVSLFQSVTTRTAGFNTVDIGALGVGTTVIFLTLMAIGASPASTAGGIKTTTVSVLLLSVWTTVRGKERVEFARRTIPRNTIYVALTAFVLAAISLFVFTFLLTITEELPFLDLLFEEFSAFATVGLSRGITSSLSDAGRLIVIVSMFIGRVGSVTLALAFANKEMSRKYQYPSESVIVA